MRMGLRLAAESVFAAALCIVACQGRAEPVEAGPEQARWLLFANSDVWREGGFAHGGALWAPSGLDQQGLVLKLMFGGGVYHYTSGALGNADVRGELLSGAILPGYRFVHDKLIATFYLGVDFQDHHLTPNDPSAELRGSYFGVRTGFEVWYEPTAMTMITADASVSSIGPSYNARLAAGFRAFDAFYVGPEVQGFAAGDNYQQVRAGLHFTGIRTGAFEWTTGVGWAIDSDHRSGAYGKLGVFTRL
jgi:Cellulose biosynthesis protein BcsS